MYWLLGNNGIAENASRFETGKFEAEVSLSGERKDKNNPAYFQIKFCAFWAEGPDVLIILKWPPNRISKKFDDCITLHCAEVAIWNWVGVGE